MCWKTRAIILRTIGLADCLRIFKHFAQILFSGFLSMKRFTLFISLMLMPSLANASEQSARLDLTASWVGIASLLLFFVAYLAVMDEVTINHNLF